MKFKKIISILSAALAISTLSACTPTNQQVTFKDYWFSDANSPSYSTETLVYDVSFKQGSGLDDNSFDLDYTDGEYKTSLTLKINPETNASYYVYETSLTITANFTYQGKTEKFTDTVNTYVEIEKNGSLKPIKSKREYVSHSPTNNTATSLNTCYSVYDYTVETTYINNGAKLSVKGSQQHGDEQAKEVEINRTFSHDGKYTYLDNEELLLALRGITQSSSSSHAFYSYDYGKGSVQTVNASFSKKQEGKQREFTLNGNAYKGAINYYEVSVVYGGKNPGNTQTVELARTMDPMSNEFRNVILQMQVPVSYNYGTLTYTLKSADFLK